MSFSEIFANFGDNVIIKHRKLVVASFLVFFLFSLAGLKRIVFDNSYASMLDKDNPINVQNRDFQKYFGNGDFAFIMVEAPNTTAPNVLRQIQSLTIALEDSLPFVKEVKSFSNLEFLSADAEAISIDKLMPDDVIPESDSAIASLRNRIVSKKMYLDRLTNKELTQAGIFISFETLGDSVYVKKKTDNIFSSDILKSEEVEGKDLSGYRLQKNPLMLIAPSLDYILDKHKNEYCSFSSTGVPVISYNVNTILTKEAAKSFVMTLIIIVGILAFLYRSTREVVAPLCVILSSVLMTFGIIGWLGFVVTTFALIVALLLMVISVSYSIHVINHFRKSLDIDGNRKNAIRYTYLHSGWACLLSAITTMVGFASFVFVDMVPVRNLGVTSAIGVVIVYCLTMFMLPVLLSYGKDKKNNKSQYKHAFGVIEKFPVFSITHTKPILITTILLLVVSGYMVTRIKADTDFINLFGEKNAFVRDANKCTQNLGSLYSYEVLIELPEEGMAKTPEVLMAEETLDSLINTFPTTKFTTSVNDLIKDVNQTLHSGDSSYFRIPEDPNLLSQYLLLYEIAGGTELEKCVDLDYKRIRHSVRIRRSTTDLQHDFDKIVSFGQKIFPEGTQISIVGDMSVFLRAVSSLVKGQVISLVFSFIGIFIVLLLVFRSFRVASVIMIPNVIPVFFIGGVMGVMGITLNLQTIVAAPVIMGLAVDDTIHYVVSLKNVFKKTGDYKQASITTFKRVGNGIIYTSIILFAGFLTFFFTPVVSLHNISLLLVVGVVVALFADLLLTPALFTYFKALGKEK